MLGARGDVRAKEGRPQRERVRGGEVQDGVQVGAGEDVQAGPHPMGFQAPRRRGVWVTSHRSEGRNNITIYNEIDFWVRI